MMFVLHERPRINPCCCGVMSPFLVRKLITAAHIIFSRTLHMADVSATGLKLAMVAFGPPLWMGTMWASFHCWGISPLSIELLNSCCSLGAISSAHSFMTCVSIPSGHAALFGFRDSRTSSTNSAVTVISVRRSWVWSGNDGGVDNGSSLVSMCWGQLLFRLPSL